MIINEPENELNLNSNNDEKPSTEDEEKENDIKPVDVPPKSLYGNNLKKIKSFKKLFMYLKQAVRRALLTGRLKCFDVLGALCKFSNSLDESNS